MRALDISGPASIPVSGKKFIPPVGRNAERKALDMDVSWTRKRTSDEVGSRGV